jgi:hypothetical protein
LSREAAGEGTDFVVAADVDDRALEDRVYRETIDHGLDLGIVEGAAIAREEIVDRCTMPVPNLPLLEIQPIDKAHQGC